MPMPSRPRKRCPPGGHFSMPEDESGSTEQGILSEREFSTPKRRTCCAKCTKNAPKDRAEKIKKKNTIFLKKHLPNARRCDKISLGCKGLVRYKSCRPAICVDAGGCHPAIVAMGYFRGVCPILEPGEKITDSDGIRSLGGVTCETGGTNVRI